MGVNTCGQCTAFLKGGKNDVLKEYNLVTRIFNSLRHYKIRKTLIIIQRLLLVNSHVRVLLPLPLPLAAAPLLCETKEQRDHDTHTHTHYSDDCLPGFSTVLSFSNTIKTLIIIQRLLLVNSHVRVLLPLPLPLAAAPLLCETKEQRDHDTHTHTIVMIAYQDSQQYSLSPTLLKH